MLSMGQMNVLALASPHMSWWHQVSCVFMCTLQKGGSGMLAASIGMMW